jgi:predicted Zn finger-like uncharacterized protein
MPQEKYTRCPGCRTIFRVTPAQLAMRGGQVRCGHCKTVFDGNAQLIALAPTPRTDSEDSYNEAALGPATVTLRDAHPVTAPPRNEGGRESPRRDEASPAAAKIVRPAAVDEIPYDERFAWRKRKQPRRGTSVLYAVAVPVLVVLLVGQVLFHFRDAVAARWPGTKPALNAVCAVAGCAIRPLHEISGLAIEASDLQADAAHKGLLILSATLRNRTAWPLAYPHLELTLTDAGDQTVVRRALAPADYLTGAAEAEGGIPGGSEVAVKLFIDASATTQAGYRLYLFYP